VANMGLLGGQCQSPFRQKSCTAGKTCSRSMDSLAPVMTKSSA
jgi:hypothetical protein